MSFGGPTLGYFCTRNQYVRRMAGRLVGETIDAERRRCYTLTLSTREQHIRRAKATSNMCSNEGLMAIVAGIYLAAMGKQGLRQVAELCYHNAHYLAAEIDQLPGFRVWRDKPFFQEFVVNCPQPAAELNQILLGKYHLIGGYALSRDDPRLSHHLLVCATEMTTRAEIDLFLTALREVANGEHPLSMSP